MLTDEMQLLEKTTKMRPLVLGVLGMSVLARICWYLYNPSLTEDEVALANNILRYDIIDLCTRTLDEAQSAPVGYLFSVKVITCVFGNSEFALRLFAFVCSLLALFFYYKLATQILNPPGVLLAVFLFGLSAPMIYHAAEVKQYSTEMLMSVLLLWLMVKYRYGITWKQAVVLSVAGAVCVLFSNPGIFLLSGAGIAVGLHLVGRREYKSMTGFVVAGSVWLVVFAVYYYFIIQNNKNVEVFRGMWQSEFLPIPTNIRWYARMVLRVFSEPLGLSLDYRFLPVFNLTAKYLLFFSYAALLLLALGIRVFLKKDKYLFWIFFLPVCVTAVASFMKLYPFHERFLLFLCPVFFLILSKSSEALQLNIRLPVVKIATALTIIFVVVNLVVKTLNPGLFGTVEKYSQMREAFQYIKDNHRADEPVCIMWDAEPFYIYYNHRQNLDWRVTYTKDPKGDNRVINAKIHEMETKKLLDQLFDKNERVWFVIQSGNHFFQMTDEPLVNLAKEDLQPIEDFYVKILEKDNRILKTYSGVQAQVHLLERLDK